MKKILVILIILCFVPAVVWAQGASPWVDQPECDAKIVKVVDDDGVVHYYQEDCPTEDEWGNDYEPWAASGGAGAGE